DVVRSILRDIEERGMIYDHAPICGVNANSANPHYSPTQEAAQPITEGDFVLIDLWAREQEGQSVFGDITWVGYVGESVPERYEEVFTVVRDGRDAALQKVQKAFANGTAVTGADLDDAARDVIREAGYAEQFVHRTGHSITHELHGAGTNLDNFET